MRRVVLAEGVTTDDVDDAMHRCGWQLTNVLPSSAERPGQLIYATSDGRTVLYLVDDTRLGVVYFTASGERVAEALAEVAEQLEHCPSAPLSPDMLAGEVDLLVFRRTLGAGVLLADGCSGDAVRLFEQAFAHDDAQVRALALTAASYAPWTELRPLLERVRDGDPMAALRTSAATLVTALFKGGS